MISKKSWLFCWPLICGCQVFNKGPIVVSRVLDETDSCITICAEKFKDKFKDAMYFAQKQANLYQIFTYGFFTINLEIRTQMLSQCHISAQADQK